MLRLSIDFEFPAQAWWDAGGRELWEAIAQDGSGSSVVLDQDLARSWLDQAQGIPGWAEGPDYAPHPIAVSPVEEDDPGAF